MSLPNPSKAQLETVQFIKNGNNILLDCCAGSGKTTTVMHVALNSKDKKILVLTYNKKLKCETRERVQLLELDNVEVHSYHSFCVKYYDRKCFTDSVIDQIIKENKQKLIDFSYDLVIIDEAQDMTQTYFELVCKLLKDINNNTQICVLGDRNQSIYGYSGADERYITYAKNIFNFSGIEREWKTVLLNTSYRITSNIASFLNICAFRYERMKAIKNGPKVNYIIYNPFSRVRSSLPYTKIINLLQKYDYEDIFILAPSVRSQKAPIRKLANALSDDGYPIYVPSDHDNELDNNIIKGKIVFSTYHQTKGLERKVVMVYGCDASYFKYYSKYTTNHTKCPNAMYVAWTRAQERLLIMHSSRNGYLPFLDKTYIGMYADVDIEDRIRNTVGNATSGNGGNTAVTDLTRHISSRVMDRVMGYIDFKQIEDTGDLIDIPIQIKDNDRVEGVSDITGTAIPAYCEYLVQDRMTITTDLYGVLDEGDLGLLNLNDLTPAKLLKIANYYQSAVSGYNYRINQIKRYDWLTEDNLEKCTTRVIDKISEKTKFEYKVTLSVNSKDLVGFIDAVESDTIYEFKCTKELSDEHFIQLAIYAYMYEKMMLYNLEVGLEINCNGSSCTVVNIHDTGDIDVRTDEGRLLHISNLRLSGKRYILYNILTNETWEIIPDMGKLRRMIEYLVEEKYSPKELTDDDVFIQKVNEIKKKYFSLSEAKN